MLTYGYIIETNKPNENIYTVRIPIFEKAGSSATSPELCGSYFEATLSQTPGQYTAYAVGDCVVIGFLDNKYSKPIILGKLYLGDNPEAAEKDGGFLRLNNINVEGKARLPSDTSIGDVSLLNIASTIQQATTLGEKVEYLYSQLGSGTAGVSSIGGATGDIELGTGLSMDNNVLSSTGGGGSSVSMTVTGTTLEIEIS